jgi:ankyrin repeat protein
MLLSRDAPVDGRIAASTLLRTVPLHSAIRYGHIEVVKTLLQHGARIDIIGFDGETAIEVAVWSNQWEVVQLLMASCDCFPFHLLCVALSRSSINPEVLDLLCSKPIMPDSQTTSREFILLLGKLLFREARELANLLLEKGSHVSIEPHMHWFDSSEQEDSLIAKVLPDRDGVLFDIPHPVPLASREDIFDALETHWSDMKSMGVLCWCVPDDQDCIYDMY